MDATDKTGAPLGVGARVHVAGLGKSPHSCGVVVGRAVDETRLASEPWLWVHHYDGSLITWPASELIRDNSAPQVAD